MSKIVISTDSTADMPKELLEKLNVETIPLHVNYGDESFLDGVDITPSKIYSRFDKDGELPKTSAVSIQEYIDFFKSQIDAGATDLIHIALSSGISSTYHNACLAAEEIEDANISVIDSKQLSAGETVLVLKACRLRDLGYSAKEIYNTVSDNVKNAETSFFVEHLNYLHKGGRCSAASAMGANILGICPSLEMTDEGKISISKKYRGRKDDIRLKFITDTVNKFSGRIDTDFVILGRTEGYDEQSFENVKKQVKKELGVKEIYEYTAGCVITSHCGPDTLGFMFLHK